MDGLGLGAAVRVLVRVARLGVTVGCARVVASVVGARVREAAGYAPREVGAKEGVAVAVVWGRARDGADSVGSKASEPWPEMSRPSRSVRNRLARSWLTVTFPRRTTTCVAASAATSMAKVLAAVRASTEEEGAVTVNRERAPEEATL